MATGKVYLVGAGPGDPGLLTVRGQQVLREADAVVYDHLVSPHLLAECRPTARRMYVGKEADRHTTSQTVINRVLVREARAGRCVVRLKGGDPFVFGRGGEEAEALARARIPFEIVPGVNSATAVPAYAGIPVTHRGLSSSVAIVTGHEDPAKPGTAIRWEQLATATDTLVFLMGVRTLPRIAQMLQRYGRAGRTPCAVIEWGTTARQRTITATLATIADTAQRARVQAPAVLVVGEVVSLRRRLAWCERRPLFGARILVTRAAEKAGPLADRLVALGAHVEQLPAIVLAPVPANGTARATVERIPQADWVFFTSPEGIAWFRKWLKPYRRDLRCLAGCHIGAIGPKTAAAVEAHGVHVDFVPRRFSQEGMVAEFPKRSLDGKQALILSAEESRDVLAAGLRRKGMRVTTVPIYRTVMPQALAAGVRELFREPFNFVIVTSASCVEHLRGALQAAGKGAEFRRLRFASIGPVTSAAVRAAGGRVAVEASTSTIEGVIAAMIQARTR